MCFLISSLGKYWIRVRSSGKQTTAVIIELCKYCEELPAIPTLSGPFLLCVPKQASVFLVVIKIDAKMIPEWTERISLLHSAFVVIEWVTETWGENLRIQFLKLVHLETRIFSLLAKCQHLIHTEILLSQCYLSVEYHSKLMIFP